MKTGIACAMLSCLMGNVAEAAAEGRISGSIESDPIDDDIALIVDPIDYADTLTGDWGGLRSNLADKGITIELTHRSDLLANNSGGIKTGKTWLAHTDANIILNFGRIAGWDNTEGFIQYHAQHGNQTDDFNSNYVGSFSGVDNIETGIHAAQLSQAWLATTYFDNSLSLLAGLYTIDSEFYVTETSGLFIQPPYGFAAEMAQAGQSGPSIFPVGALAVRMQYNSSNYYFRAVLTDGVPDSPESGTDIKLDKTDGTLTVVEIGYTPKNSKQTISKTSLGWWNYSASAADLQTGESRADQGVYIMSEHTLFTERNNTNQGLSGFLRFGTANKDVYQADWTGSVGLHYLGLLPGRDDDQVGVAMTTSHASDNYRSAQLALPTPNPTDDYETAFELTYRVQILPWLAIQPTLQRFMNPGMNKALDDASVAGVRVEIKM